ncbi:hypothetical protein NC653_016214 [Populus alba x Populus x berolinensis]|uniref:Uncharacterized protein n=1 Tax=Populus alba x Populus x berolinensis TaxID=444605 RepID=A0AAD6QMF2_9ROSI|nr:hypothetical protein NC653_016214 [Populus alba x Populus x berolinensis]
MAGKDAIVDWYRKSMGIKVVKDCNRFRKPRNNIARFRGMYLTTRNMCLGVYAILRGGVPALFVILKQIPGRNDSINYKIDVSSEGAILPVKLHFLSSHGNATVI